MKTFCEIDSYQTAEVLRVIRNECAEWMTNSTEQITAEQQREFYESRIASSPRTIEGSILYDDYAPVGYAYLVWDDWGNPWSSTGVLASMRGMGYGKAVFRENVRRAHSYGKPLYAEVRCDNKPQQHVSRTTPGFVLMETGIEKNGVLIDIQRWDP
jgi:GNAT superfamily N-acetyltransferase